MNNNEAKKTILEAESCFCKHGAYKDCHSGCKYREALDAAVKALEQKPTLLSSGLEKNSKLEKIREQMQADYEARLKADMVAMLEDLRLDFQEAELVGVFDNKELIFADEVDDLVQQKINSLKED